MNLAIQIESSWKKELREEFEKSYFKELTDFVKGAYAKKNIYPLPGHIFRAFDLCPFEKVKVVILGQDPYHGAEQANGLSFSVGRTCPKTSPTALLAPVPPHRNSSHPKGTSISNSSTREILGACDSVCSSLVPCMENFCTRSIKIPPSLQNIFKELSSDLGKPLVNIHGDLSGWAKQGVLMLNATLTVEQGKAGSHQGKGWEQFTDAVIDRVSKKPEHVVFILWGNYARAKGARIDRNKHLVLESPHPSPFSAYNGFFGSKPFSKANEYLIAHNKTPIDWV